MTEIIIAKHDYIFNKTVKIILKSINQILEVKDTVVLGLPGGRSISKILSTLKTKHLDWNKIHIFMVDERIVPPDHKENNFRLIKQELINIVPAKNLHSFPYDPQNVGKSTENYTTELKAYGGKFDIVYLSAGEDGHIASLFPKQSSLYADSQNFIFITNSPKPPPNRISISKNLLLKTKIGILLFSGKEKQSAFQNYLKPDYTYYDCPAKLIDQLPQSYVISEFNKS